MHTVAPSPPEKWKLLKLMNALTQCLPAVRYVWPVVPVLASTTKSGSSSKWYATVPTGPFVVHGETPSAVPVVSNGPPPDVRARPIVPPFSGPCSSFAPRST